MVNFSFLSSTFMVPALLNEKSYWNLTLNDLFNARKGVSVKSWRIFGF